MFEDEGSETLSCSIRGVPLSTADTPRSVHMVCGIWYVVYVGFMICDFFEEEGSETLRCSIRGVLLSTADALQELWQQYPTCHFFTSSHDEEERIFAGYLAFWKSALKCEISSHPQDEEKKPVEKTLTFSSKSIAHPPHHHESLGVEYLRRKCPLHGSKATTSGLELNNRWQLL